MSYVEAVGYTMLGAAVTVYLTLYFERYITRLFAWLMDLIPGRDMKQPPLFNPTLRKALRFYRRYGFWGLMALTPILIGLPVGIWIAIRLGSSKRRVGLTALAMSLFWSTVSYWVTLNGVAQLTG
jgi:hypothetical protein